MPDQIEAVPHNLQSFLGFLAKKLSTFCEERVNYCFHFEAILIFACPILKLLPCYHLQKDFNFDQMPDIQHQK